MNENKKVAIVTGATRGIGRATAIKLLELNYEVVGIFYSNEELAFKLIQKYPKLMMIKGDVGKEKDVLNIIKTVTNKYERLDVVVNNAGIDLYGNIDKFETKNWDRMMDVNLKSVFLFSKYSIPYLKKSDNPIIINISSRIGMAEFSEPEFVVYGTTKAAVSYFTQALAKELENTKIRVNALIPTPTKTDMFDEVFTKEDEDELKNKGKLGKPEDVAALIVELIQDKNANGKILVDKRVNLF